MIRNAMFYLNQSKPSVFDTVRVCAELCRERGIEPIFFEANREELIEKLDDEAETARDVYKRQAVPMRRFSRPFPPRRPNPLRPSFRPGCKEMCIRDRWNTVQAGSITNGP